MIKEYLQRVYRFLVTIDSEPDQKVNETVPIEEYNKTKQALEETKAKIATLEKANETIINQNYITLAETERLESEIRVLKIKSILDATTLSDTEKEKQLEVLPRSSLPIEFIQSTYEPITKKNISKVGTASTKLPQKSVPIKDKDFSYVK
jgi:hypothetical protein